MSIREFARPHAVFTIVLACLAALVAPGIAGATTLPAGFQQTTAITGLNNPMDVEVTPAGQVFVAEKSGIVKSFSSLSDPTPTVAADLRTQVHNFSARGLMSLAVDPGFPAQPYIYIYYTLDARIGGTPPLYGDPGGTWDSCARAPLGLDENCIAGGRISRLRIAGEAMTGSEQVLVEDWCQQYPVHTGGGLAFGADGYLYFTGGDGSTATFWDYGHTGTPANPCGDPPGAVGDVLTAPTAEGGRLRVQDLRTPGDPTGLDGTLIRIDPRTGAGVSGNPLFGSPDANERRILAYGLRDAVRLAIRPGTNDVWVGDRGGGYWEEFNRVPDTGSVRNFGWPCYEGGIDAQGDPYTRIRPRSVEENTNICNNLYAAGDQTLAPHWAYDHELPIVPGETCTEDALGAPAGSLLSGMSFYPAAGGSFPAPYREALFFADRLRDCIYALLPGSDGLPERGNVMLFASEALHAMDLEVMANGNLLYVDQVTDGVHSIKYVGNPANQAPTAVAAADKVSGGAPLTVEFDGTGSTDPDARDAFTYEWDLDGDGAFDDSTSARPTSTFRRPGTSSVSVRVTDTGGLSDTDSLAIEITEPLTTLTFSPTADARVEEAHPIDNYGVSDKIRAALGPGTESFLRFQLSGINGPIRSAKLTLTATTNGTVDGPGVHSVSGDWSESTVTWATRPGHGSIAASDAGAIAANAKVEYDVKPLLTGDGTLDLALVATSTDGVDLSSKEHLNSAKRPVLEVTFATVFDDEAPTAPADLAAQVASQSRVDLSWTAAADNVGVTNYEIYRDGQLLDVVGNDTSYADTNVSVETPYEYTVRAVDAEQNRSAASNTAQVTVPDSESPTTPGNLTAQVAGAARVDLSWAASIDNVAVTNYEIYRDGQLLATVGNVTTYSDTGVGVETPYQYAVRALDARQNRSAASNVATVTVPDTVKPTAPAGLVAQVAGPARVDLAWTASTDNVAVANYEIYRNGALLAVIGNVTGYSDITVKAEVAYQYTVRALDVRQNRSDASNTVAVTVPDVAAPTAPGNLAAQAVSGARVDLAWTASTDNVGVANYEVFRNGVLLAVIGNVTTYADTLVTPLTSYQYTVRAVDGKQNRSAASNVANATTLAPVATFSPVADAHVEEAKKNNNYGSAFTLRTVKGSGRNVFESYLRFDVSGVPGPIKSAKLRLSATTATPDGPGVHSALSSWAETAITWATKPARGLAPVDDKAAIAAGATVEYDVKPLVSGNGTVSFALVSTSAVAEDFASREFANATRRPQLIIGY
jgi:glucose/arabinose dehydrogenase/fibronectin type 3 domain-containing protein